MNLGDCRLKLIFFRSKILNFKASKLPTLNNRIKKAAMVAIVVLLIVMLHSLIYCHMHVHSFISYMYILVCWSSTKFVGSFICWTTTRSELVNRTSLIGSLFFCSRPKNYKGKKREDDGIWGLKWIYRFMTLATSRVAKCNSLETFTHP